MTTKAEDLIYPTWFFISFGLVFSKLVGFITWHWAVVLLPIWLPILAFFMLIVMSLICIMLLKILLP